MIDLRPRNDPKRLMDEAKDWAATCRQQEERIERLRAALSRLLAACEAKDAWSETDTTKAFDNMLYEYERAQDEARTALQGDAP